MTKHSEGSDPRPWEKYGTDVPSMPGGQVSYGAPVLRRGFRENGSPDEIKKLYSALVSFQKIMPIVGKDQSAKITSKKGAGSSFSYKYAALDSIIRAIQEPLGESGLAILQVEATPSSPEFISVCTRIIHSGGGCIEGTIELQPESHDPKGIGSAITYARRYGLSILGIVTEEDSDGGGVGNGRTSTRGRQNAASPSTSPPPQGDDKGGRDKPLLEKIRGLVHVRKKESKVTDKTWLNFKRGVLQVENCTTVDQYRWALSWLDALKDDSMLSIIEFKRGMESGRFTQAQPQKRD